MAKLLILTFLLIPIWNVKVIGNMDLESKEVLVGIDINF